MKIFDYYSKTRLLFNILHLKFNPFVVPFSKYHIVQSQNYLIPHHFTKSLSSRFIKVRHFTMVICLNYYF